MMSPRRRNTVKDEAFQKRTLENFTFGRIRKASMNKITIRRRKGGRYNFRMTINHAKPEINESFINFVAQIRGYSHNSPQMAKLKRRVQKSTDRTVAGIKFSWTIPIHDEAMLSAAASFLESRKGFALMRVMFQFSNRRAAILATKSRSEQS